MTHPVLLISDTHYHNYSQYAQIAPSGVNTRLGDILRATLEAAKAVGPGATIIHCGDVFHVRGSLPPSVLNPVVDMYAMLVRSGYKIHMISGNHDLETDQAARVSSSVSALEAVGVNVIHKPGVTKIGDETWLFVPWIKDMDALRKVVRLHPTDNLVIHAPLNGVITGIPDHGLSPNDFKGLGFKRVFCGHYHNHRRFGVGLTDVFSVGALTHQNWGDVGSKAGYLILEPTGVRHVETSAPKFIKVSADDIATHSDTYYADNYIKVVDGDFTDPADVQAVKDDLLLRGAKHVTVEGLTRRPVATRGVVKTGSAPTIETILGDYLDRTYPGDTDVKATALEIIGLTNDYS